MLFEISEVKENVMAFKNGIIDFRSDTVTHPTQEMREAMFVAEIGDDVYGDDPTVNLLEKKSAEMLGKEAALFTASGTMGNLIAVLTHCGRGDEAVMGSQGHTFLHEVGGISALGGVFPQLIPSQNDGTMALDDIRNAIREDDIHHPETRLFILENTQNACGGIPIPCDYVESLSSIIKYHDIKLHIDGARIFNAAVALDQPVSNLTTEADSVMFCLSKGLCAPVGSILCGSNEFITRARKIRKQLGGGMRQAGILAAAGIIALEKMPARLGEDHKRAKRLAAEFETIVGIEMDKGMPESNMVYIKLADDHPMTPDKLIQICNSQHILIGQSGSRHFRFVLHYWIDDADVEHLVRTLKSAMII
jgi:threonine aldolase